MDDQDRKARWIVLVCVALFLIATACKINGSSAALWSSILRDPGTRDSLLVSTPESVRSDEWMVWTPAMLSQVNHQPPFPVVNESLGAGKSPLLMSLPVRHYSMIFRPQLYGFFFLDVERAFAWYWNIKVFGLIAAMFLLLRKLTENEVLPAMAGSLWVFLSAFVQWWFSCPPMLPEMLGCWALALVCVMTILTSQRQASKAFATLGLVLSGVNFALCMYPPFQIPLIYLGAAVLAGWICERRSNCLPLTAGRGAFVYLFAAALVMACVSGACLLELKPTLEIVASTSYPGARRIFGGGMGLATLFSGFMGPFMSEKSYPDRFSNICEAANFYPMWIVAMLAAFFAFRRRLRENMLPLCILVYLLGFAAFCVHPLPEWFCRVTLWDLTTENRVTLGIGLAGILLTVIVLQRLKKGKILTHRERIWIACIAGAMTTFLLLLAAHENPLFCGAGIIAFSTALALVLAALFLWASSRIFYLVLLCALAPAGLLVNPVMTGLAPLTKAAPADAILALRKADPEARWVAYDSSLLSAFLMSTGAPVLSGAKTLPDLAFYHRIDPAGASADIYNRYSIVMFEMPERREDIRFELINFCGHRNYIHPTNPVMAAMGVRYFVYKEALADPAVEGLKLVRDLPANRIWIYRLADHPMAGQ